jgi:hypothetical protein
VNGNEAINFIKPGLWKKKLRAEGAEEKRKIIGTRWVYKKKDEQDGSIRYKGHIVSESYLLGYTGAAHGKNPIFIGYDPVTSTSLHLTPSLHHRVTLLSQHYSTQGLIHTSTPSPLHPMHLG